MLHRALLRVTQVLFREFEKLEKRSEVYLPQPFKFYLATLNFSIEKHDFNSIYTRRTLDDFNQQNIALGWFLEEEELIPDLELEELYQNE